VPGPVDARPSQRQLTPQGVARSAVVHVHRPYGRLWLWRPRPDRSQPPRPRGLVYSGYRRPP
jgi:hypothetical protein